MRPVPATFTAMLRAGTETNLFYTYFTDLPQVLLAGQAANITQYVNTKTVPDAQRHRAELAEGG